MARHQTPMEILIGLMRKFAGDVLTKASDEDIERILDGEAPATACEDLVKCRDEHEGTILHWASRLGHVDLTTSILSKLPDAYLNQIIMSQDKYGNTPLHQACFCNQSKMVTDIFSRVKAPIQMPGNEVLKRNTFGFTTLHWACRYSASEVVREIIDNVSDGVFGELVMATDNEYGCTALHFACRYGRNDSIRAILQRLKDINNEFLEVIILKQHTYDKNKFPFVDEGHSETEKMISLNCIKGISAENPFEQKGGQTALMWGCVYGHLDVLKVFECVLGSNLFGQLLVVVDDWYGQNVLQWVSGRGHSEIVRFVAENIDSVKFAELIQTKANKEIIRGNSLTAIHWACGRGHTCVLEVVKTHVIPQIFEKLIAAKSTTGQTPLHWACNSGHAAIVVTIAETLKASRGGGTWEELLSSNDKEGITALHCACQFGHDNVVKAIVKHSQTELINRISLMTATEKKWTPLHMACAEGHQGVAKVLADRFTSLEMVKLNSLQTECPLGLAVQKKHFGIVSVVLLERNFWFFENSVKGLSDSLVVEMCHRGDVDSVLSILHAAKNMDRYGNLLRKFFEATDEDGRNALHVACCRGDVYLIRELIMYLSNLGQNVCESIICNVDHMEKGLIFGSSLENSDLIAQLTLDSATKHECERRMLKQSFWDGFEMGYNKVVSCILNQASQSKEMLEAVLLSTNDEETNQTIVHWACKNKYDNLQCIKTVLRVVKRRDMDMKLLCQEDESGRTFLSYVSDANEDVVNCLIEYITEWETRNEIKTLCHWFLTNPDKQGKTAVHWIREEAKMELLTHFLTRVQKNLEKDWSQSTTNQPMADVIEIKTSTSDAVLKLEKRPRKARKVVGGGKGRPSDFYLLHKGSDSNSRDRDKEPSLLDVMTETKCLALIEHDYTQAYLEACLNSYVWRLFIPYLVVYLLQLVSLSVFVLCHQARPFINSSNSSISPDIHITRIQPLAVIISQWTLLLFAALILVAEALQMAAKGRYYIYDLSNYVELSVCICSLIISVVSLSVGYSPGLHHACSVTMCLAWMNLAVILRKLSGKGKWSKVNLLFVMLFKVLKSICYFLLVATIFILMVALVFSNLLHAQQPFSHAGFSMMSALAMTVGELSFTDIFFTEHSSESPPLYRLTCVLFVIFVVILTIAVMNLLVGTAVGEISHLRSQSKVIAFKTSVTLARECQAVIDLFDRCKRTGVNRQRSYSPVSQIESSV